MPYLKQYAARDYGGGEANYSAARSAMGLLYVANDRGVLQFDGQRWLLLPVAAETQPKVVAAGIDGRVYAIAGNQLFVLTASADGKPAFVRVAIEGYTDGNLPGETKGTYTRADGLYIATAAGMVVAHKGTAKKCVNNSAPAKRMAALSTLAHLPGRGLVAVANGEVQRWMGNAMLSDLNVVGMVPMPGKQVLVATEKTLFRFNGWTLQPFLPYEVEEYLATNVISAVQALTRDLFAISTLRGGIIVINAKGEQLTKIDRAVGLQNETVYSLLRDAEGGLWLCLQSGITRANLLAPTTFFNSNAGLQGAVNDLVRYQGRLYAATEFGLYVLDETSTPAQFRPVAGIVKATFSLVPSAKRLFAATATGVYEVEGENAKPVWSRPVTQMEASTVDPNLYFLGLPDGVATLRIVPYAQRQRVQLGTRVKRWEWRTLQLDSLSVRRVPGPRAATLHLTADPKGRVWVTTADSLLLIEPADTPIRRAYTTADGLEAGKPPRIWRLGGRILAIQSKGVYELDNRDGRFIRDEELSRDGQQIQFLHQDNFNDRLVLAGGDLRYGAWNATAKSYAWDSTALQIEASTSLRAAYRQDATQYWLGFGNGMIRFEPRRKQMPPPPYRVVLRSARIDGDSLVYGGLWADSLNPAASDSLYAEGFAVLGQPTRIALAFAGTRFDDNARLQYQYALREAGSDEPLKWSAPSTTPEAELSGLELGDYELHLRARDISGRYSSPTVYAFHLVPHWYQTWWARLLFFVLGVGIIAGLAYGSALVYSARLRAKNQRLEAIITERTREIEDKNKALEAYAAEMVRQKQEIERKNRDITDSINYAKRIQQAMLPRNEQLKAALDEFFILYSPRDIVSGDFYWYAQHGHTLVLAAGDCTGHGVPGALMSMIGSSILNRIVNERQETNPARILEELHQGVRAALNQENAGKDQIVRDGMDICIVTIDVLDKRLWAASANRPIWRIVNGELEETKGDKMAIGGAAAQHRYSLHEFALNPGDTFYLFSDGYPDQFGGERGRKFQTRRFRETLVENQHLSLKDQAVLLEETLMTWRGSRDQVDDILVIGVRF